MAIPLPDTYSAATGQGIYGGRFNNVPMDVVNNVWTPTTDVSGNILDGSWANLPLDEWCSVDGTEPQGLEDQIVAAMGRSISALNYGNGNLLATFNSWVGCAVDYDNGRVWVPWGGGHADSSINGVWFIDLERMGSWSISQNPSDPESPEWSAEYKASGSFTNYTPQLETPADILPDGKPTSRHTYNGVWYNPLTGTVNQSRRRLWKFDPGSNQIYSVIWNQAAASIYPTIGHRIYWDELAEEAIGYFARNDSDTYHWARLNETTGEVISVSGRNVGIGGVTCRIGRDIMLIDTSSAYGLFNLDTRAWHSETTLTDNPVYTYTQEMQVAVYVPEWGKVIRRFTKSPLAGAWYLFDPSTLTHSTYVPAGISMPFATYPGNKVFYYPARKSVVYINPTALNVPSVYVMRVG